jgi:hypothetical protein
MNGLIPLLFMWLYSRSGVANPLASAPQWPTPASPPPMPAFRSQRPAVPVHATADTGTPLAALHKTAPRVVPASHSSPANVKARARASPAAKRGKAASTALKYAALGPFAALRKKKRQGHMTLPIP